MTARPHLRAWRQVDGPGARVQGARLPVFHARRLRDVPPRRSRQADSAGAQIAAQRWMSCVLVLAPGGKQAHATNLRNRGPGRAGASPAGRLARWKAGIDGQGGEAARQGQPCRWRESRKLSPSLRYRKRLMPGLGYGSCSVLPSSNWYAVGSKMSCCGPTMTHTWGRMPHPST